MLGLGRRGSIAAAGAGIDGAWDVSTAVFVDSFSVSTQDTFPYSVDFKDDGTRMYVVGNTGQDINRYDLSTAWDVSTAAFVNNFSFATEDTDPRSSAFKTDGTRMYVIGNAGTDINRYDLSIAWDITSAAFVNSFSVSTQDTTPRGLAFKTDGTRMFVGGDAGDDINRYDLSAAWDISTAAFVDSFSVATQEVSIRGLAFKTDGTRMYVVGVAGDDINRYDLSTSWDVSSATFVNSFSVSTQDTNPLAVAFKTDGTRMYVVGADGVDINRYDLGS